MKYIIYLILFFLFLPYSSNADDNTFDQTMKDIAGDLSTLQHEIQSPYANQRYWMSPGQHTMTTSADKETSFNINTVSPNSDNSKIYKSPDEKADVLKTAAKGKNYPIVDEMSGWYYIQLDQPTDGYEKGWIKAVDVAQMITMSITHPPVEDKTLSDRMYEKIMTSVKAFKDKYENNPYVSVSGFSVDIGVPPSVSISFDFK